jgi:hypothetical protein
MASLLVELVFLEMWVVHPDLSSSRPVLGHKMMVDTIWEWLDVDPSAKRPRRIGSVTVCHRGTALSVIPKELHRNYTHLPFRYTIDSLELPGPTK